MTVEPVYFRRDTAANWTADNPTLSPGEPGFEKDTGKLKIGGQNPVAWNALPYFTGADGLSVAAVATSAVTLVANYHTPVNATAGSLTMTLPTGQQQGTVISVEKYDTGVNTVTVSGSLRGTTSTIALGLAHESIELVADSTGSWWPFAGYKTLSSLDGRYPKIGSVTAGTALNFTPTMLPNWRKAVARVLTGAGDAIVDFIGTSIVYGYNGTQQGARGYPEAFSKALNGAGIPSQLGGFTLPASGQADNRWGTPGTGWSIGAPLPGYGFWWGGNSQSLYTTTGGPTTAAGNTTFTPGVMADTFDVFFCTGSQAGTFLVNVDGGADTTATMTTGGGNTFAKVTVTASAPSKTHVVNIHTATMTSGQVFVTDIRPRNSQAPSVLVENFGTSGSTAQGDQAITPGFSQQNALAIHTPDLTVIDLGVNDFGLNNSSVAQVMAWLAPIISQGQLTGDVIVITPYNIGYGGAYGAQVTAATPAYVTALKALGLPVVDINGRWGSYALANAAGFFYDGLHATAAGYTDIGGAIAAAAMSVVAGTTPPIYTLPPVIAQSATTYVSSVGSDTNDGRTWGTAHATIPHAIAALPANGGTVELGYGVVNVSSTGRIDPTVTFNGTTTVADTNAQASDVGSYVVSSWLQLAVKIISVTPGVGFVLDGPASGSATVPALITKPAIELPGGVKLRGRGSSSSRTALISHQLLPAITEIVDSGTGITIMPANPGIFFSSLGFYLEDLSLTGNASNVFGFYSNDATYVDFRNVDFRKHGIAGVGGTLNENELIFRGCRFTQNGSQAATKLTGGVLLNTPASIASSSIDFTDCFWLDNWGYGVAAGAGPAAADQSAYGAFAVSLRDCEFAYGRKTANPYSGVHLNLAGQLSGTVDVVDCWLESADVIGLVTTGPGPVTCIGTMFNASGGGFNGVNSYGAEVASSGGLNLIGCTFQNATVASVENLYNAPVNWMGCWSHDPVFVVDGSAHSLVAASAATNSGSYPLIGASWTQDMRVVSCPPVTTIGGANSPSQSYPLYNASFRTSTGAAVGDGAIWRAGLATGTWRLNLLSYTYTNYGVMTFDVSLDGGTTWLAAGSLDLYGAAATVTYSGPTFTVPTPSDAMIRVRVLSKNASAAAYQWALSELVAQRIS